MIPIGEEAESDHRLRTWDVQREQIFRNCGEFWAIGSVERPLHVRGSLGLLHVGELLRRPGELILALELATVGRGFAVHSGLAIATEPNCADECLDAKALAAYRRRMAELHIALDDAREIGNAARIAEIESELDALARELRGALGLGGRGRRFGSAGERARVNVTRAIHDALRRIARHNEGLGYHLVTSIRTGTFCSYMPDPTHPIRWRF